MVLYKRRGSARNVSIDDISRQMKTPAPESQSYQVYLLWEVGFYYDEASVLAIQTDGINMYEQSINMKARYPNTPLFAQDEWKVNDRLPARTNRKLP
jgi:hypothetical protein